MTFYVTLQRILCALTLACLPATFLVLAVPKAQAESLSFERLYSDPDISGPTVRDIQFSPDGSKVAFLRNRVTDVNLMDLWELELTSLEPRILIRADTLIEGKEKISDEEQDYRERARVFGAGIVEYSWSRDGDKILFMLSGDIFVYDFNKAGSRNITNTAAAEFNALFSPSGRYVSFVRDQDLYVEELESGREQRLTFDGHGPIKNGMAEYIAGEELERQIGAWWAPDERHIAFMHVDESQVRILQRAEFEGDGVHVVQQRYPSAGTPNAIVHLGVVNVTSGSVNWVDLGNNEDIYIPRVEWRKDSRSLYVQRQTRDQQRLELLIADIASGVISPLLTEVSDTWVSLNHDFRQLGDHGEFIWASERSGMKHLYLYSADGELRHQISAGHWFIDQVACVDERSATVYVEGWLDTPLQRQLYRLSLAGTEPSAPQRVTSRQGWHEVHFSDDCERYTDTYSSSDSPPQTSLHRANGEHVAWISENRLEPGHPYWPFIASHAKREFGIIEAGDGTALHYRLIRPTPYDGTKHYPAILYVYGGPFLQTVNDAWGSNFRARLPQVWANAGFVVFQLDNRGSARRGKMFQNPLYRNFSHTELQDQLLGLRFLKSLSFVDGDRVGVFGWSGGGYRSLMLMARAGSELAAGVAGAPVVDFRYYNTHYAERYNGLLPDNSTAYDSSSVLTYLDGLTKPLLLIHGMADDNVSFENSLAVMAKLQSRGVLFELMTYPGERHTFRSREAQLHRDTTTLSFFKRHLMHE